MFANLDWSGAVGYLTLIPIVMFVPLFVISPSPTGDAYSVEQRIDNVSNCPSVFAAIGQHE